MEYAILGIHDSTVESVNVFEDVKDEENNVVGQQLTEERNVARVRMFVNDKLVDEDFVLPRLAKSAQSLHGSVLTEIYRELLDESIRARMDEIRDGILDPTSSKVVGPQPEQIVTEVQEDE